jgi:hypothetical protein
VPAHRLLARGPAFDRLGFRLAVVTVFLVLRPLHRDRRRRRVRAEVIYLAWAAFTAVSGVSLMDGALSATWSRDMRNTMLASRSSGGARRSATASATRPVGGPAHLPAGPWLSLLSIVPARTRSTPLADRLTQGQLAVGQRSTVLPWISAIDRSPPAR